MLLIHYVPLYQPYRWRVQIKVKGKANDIGTFGGEREAAEAYDEWARELGRPTNFNLDGTPGEARKKGAPRSTFSSAEKQSDFRGVSWDTRCQR